MTEGQARAFFDAMMRGDKAELERLLAEDVVLDFPGTRFGGRFEGRRKVIVFVRQNQRLFRDGLRFDVHWVGVVGDRAIAQWTNAGVTKAGEAYTNRGATVFHEVDGRIALIEDYVDTEQLAATWPE